MTAAARALRGARRRHSAQRSPLGARAGSIDYLEFKSCLRALGFAPTREELASIVREFDREGTGRVTREAFVEVCSRMYSDRPADERLAQAFALFDETGSGTITRRDLKRVFREIGEPIDDEECAAMIDEFDANKDGLIDPADFRAVLSEAMMSGF